MVDAAINISQVLNAIIAFVAVYVVYLAYWPSAVVQQPSYSVLFPVAARYLDMAIS